MRISVLAIIGWIVLLALLLAIKIEGHPLGDNWFFIIAAQLLRKFSVKQDKNGNPKFTIWLRKVSFVSLPLFALSVTFGAYDWFLGLQYRWFSTMFGVYIFAGTAGSSMSLLVLVITALRNAGYLKDVVTK